MTKGPILIAGGGIGGLTAALTLHQIGLPCVVYEAASALKPLGVGINLQPNAVRELLELDLTEAQLDAIGVSVQEWALVGRNGADIYSEPRGRAAGYDWPQYAVHRGRLHMLMAETFRARAGDAALRTGHRVTGYRQTDDGVTALVETPEGPREVHGALLLGADGIHSAVRAQMHPDQPPINWGGAIMWRGTTRARPIRTGASFVGLGSHRHRMVLYPISPPDPDCGLALINWIAEVTVDPGTGWQGTGWFSEVPIEGFARHFDDWRYDWLDVPALLRAAGVAYENPMIDRDPIPTWVDGRVLLIGDAAHPMYPTGSNGASQAIVDGRMLGAQLLRKGVGPEALAALDAALCGPVSEVVLRNRSAGPFGLLDIVDARCSGNFEDIDTVVPPEERADFMAGYKAAAGFAKEQLNAAPPIIPREARRT